MKLQSSLDRLNRSLSWMILTSPTQWPFEQPESRVAPDPGLHVTTVVTFQAMTNNLEFPTFDGQLEKRLVASEFLVLWEP
jgi:hypothetical protein